MKPASQSVLMILLTALNETSVPVRPDDPVVQPGPVDVPQCVLRVLPGVILHETEAAWSSFKLVQSHHHPLHFPAHPEQLVDLLLRGVEGHVADVQRRGLSQQPLLLPSRSLEMLVAITTQINSSHFTSIIFWREASLLYLLLLDYYYFNLD